MQQGAVTDVVDVVRQHIIDELSAWRSPRCRISAAYPRTRYQKPESSTLRDWLKREHTEERRTSRIC
jgi:DNA-binding transcriptional LysR family regulator